MLDHLKRFFNATEKEEVEMTDKTKQEVSAKELTGEQVSTALSDALTAATELNASQAAALAELTSKYETLQATLSEYEAVKVAMLAEQVANKLAYRKEKVESLIGTTKSPDFLSATQSLDDASFEAVVGSLAASVEKESKSDLFREIGASGTSEALNVEEDAVARLAAKIDAQFKPK